MAIFKRLFCVFICVVMLSSCAQNQTEDTDATPAVSIQTFGTLAEAAPTLPPETLNTDSFTEPSIVPETTHSRDLTEPTTVPPVTTITVTTTETVSDNQSDDYTIEPTTGIMYANSSVNVREQPDADSDRIGHLDKDDEVRITGLVSNGWVRIVFKDGEYYVNGRYLSADVETTSAVTTALPETTTAQITTTTPTTTITTTESLPESEIIEENLNVLTRPNSYTALNYINQKAVWLAYLDIDEMLKNADEAGFTEAMSLAMDNVLALGCNTVYVHVRAFGDAYYYSSYFPFTAAYCDILGQAPPYDPLEIMISEAHKRGLSFHAWINPMRTTSRDRYAQMPSYFTLKQWYDSDATNGTFMVYDKDTEFYWLSPAYPAVRELICNGVAEIVSRYDVDAIHIDDYFYPTTSSSFDKAAFEASGASDRAAWRRSVVNTLVREINSTVKSCNSTVLFGVSPQGNIDNNFNRLYADVKTWCSTPGYLDYIVPQIYYGFNDKLAFDAAAEQWSELAALPSVSLICGIAAYKVGVNKEWSSGEILTKQTDYISDMSRYNGIAYYRLGSLFGSASSSERLIQDELPSLRRSISQF